MRKTLLLSLALLGLGVALVGVWLATSQRFLSSPRT